MDEQYDVVVLGAGPAGEAVVRRLEGEGLSVVLVERELVGGECAYWACVPSKTLLRAPEVRGEARRVAGLSEPKQRWEEIAAYRDSTISHLDDTAKSEKMTAAGATVVRGAGRIVGRGRVAVGDVIIEAEHIVVATGTVPSIPAIEGIEGIELWTTRDVYTMATPPRDAIVLGGGPVGVETAQMLAGHGVCVTVVEEAERLLAREEPAVGEQLARHLAKTGVELELAARAVGVERVNGRVTVHLASGSRLEAERVIAAVGRTPRVAGIGLEAIGIEPGESGGVDIDGRCRAGEGVWAVGDVTSIMPFTHVAHYQGEIAADDMLGRPREADYRAIPRVVFSDPEVAAVGLTRGEAEAQGINVAQGTVEIKTLPRTATYGDDYDGFMSVLADRDRDVLIGAWAVAPLASEWIAATVIAIKARVPLSTLRDTPMQFPTFAEGLSYAIRNLDA